jgi:hypothetical protein
MLWYAVISLLCRKLLLRREGSSPNLSFVRVLIRIRKHLVVDLAMFSYLAIMVSNVMLF